ncbi:lrr receptor-like serine/threonine-protein kinase efr [Quercus suber]|uniref:Lrr receptor-like serine/threonine-protein kinase efr n=1 Tax=Quercus suber TaxID=58331 RepID=A0AAW0KRW9_QUESU
MKLHNPNFPALLCSTFLHIIGMIPTCFGKFQKMQVLHLDGNKLSGKIPSYVGNLTQLVELFLSQNNLEESIPPSIGTCQSLQKLDVSQNYLSGVIPQQELRLIKSTFVDLGIRRCRPSRAQKCSNWVSVVKP